MTYEEAHGYIEDMQRILTQYRFIFSREIAEANGKAIEALEKQIPKKVIWRSGGDGLPLAYCSACGKSVMYSDYCDNCGQKLEF